MSKPVSRRSFLGAGATAAALGFVFAGAGSLAPFVRPGNFATRNAVGYGTLVPDPNGILALPEGFSYKLLARSGQTATAEGVHPSDPDGMGVFDGPNGGSVLICNHENNGEEPFPVPVLPPPVPFPVPVPKNGPLPVPVLQTKNTPKKPYFHEKSSSEQPFWQLALKVLWFQQ